MIVQTTRQASPPVRLSDSYEMDVGSRLVCEMKPKR